MRGFQGKPPIADGNLTLLARNFCKQAVTKAAMDRGSKRRVADSVYDKPLPLKGRPEV